MRYRVVHRTEYVYAEPVTLCHNETHLTPRASAAQRVFQHDLVIEPNPAGLIPPELANRTLRILSDEVMPAFK